MIRRIVLAAFALVAATSAHASTLSWGTNYTTTAQFSGAPWSSANAGAVLDPNYYSTTPSLQDLFNDSSTPCSTIGTETFAHDPNPAHKWWSTAGSQGSGTFIPISGAGGVNPFDCSTGHLIVTLSNPSGTQWQGGNIQSQDAFLDGFTMTYGYIEAEIMFPSGPPTGLQPWAAPLWTVGRLANFPIPNTYQEIDYETGLVNNSPTSLAISEHRWPSTPPIPKGMLTAEQTQSVVLTFNAFDGVHHKYGILRSPNKVILYTDRVETLEIPIFGNEMRSPARVLSNMLVFFAPTAATSTTFQMNVYSITVYPCPPGMPLCQ